MSAIEHPVSEQDKAVIRKLAEETAQIASLPVHKEKAGEWQRMNDLQPGRPMVWIIEIPWHEMNVDNELTNQCRDPFWQNVEGRLRRQLYQWKHLRGDMIVDPTFTSELVIPFTGFGIRENVDIARKDEHNTVVSRDFHAQIDSEEDVRKIRNTTLTLDKEASEAKYRAFQDTLGDLLTVEQKGINHFWFAPWDELIRWWDVEKALLDLALRPELVHAAMQRLVDAYLDALRQWRDLNILTYDAGNYKAGSGGLAYTKDLPADGFDPGRVRTQDQWGCATAQIFSDVSPAMHEEFALQYELKWLEQFGLNYYGCCEPLHNKMDILEAVPRLRKISTSPWADIDKMVEKSNGRHVLSCKPNPAILAEDRWRPEQARKEIEGILEKTRGCAIEIILKDISTVNYEPKRLWEWADIVMEVVQEKAKA